MTNKSPLRTLYDHPSDMEPLLPGTGEAPWSDRVWELIRGAERLRAALHPITRQRVAELVRSMNSYCSNLIEGHRIRPRDIDAALQQDFSANADQRALQIQHLAHMEVQAKMDARLPAMAGGEICSADFLCWLHAEFYQRLPESFRLAEGEAGKLHPVQPGALRRDEVSVGRHLAPTSKKLGDFLKRFADFYGPLVTSRPDSLIAAAAAHHRLTWIHPFLDGNGRVARLFSLAWFIKSGVDSDGLWTLSRGLARRQQEYQAALAIADEKRVNDFDGRGYLSQRYLGEFSAFFLGTAADQVGFMEELLALDGLLRRITGHAQRGEAAGKLPRSSAEVLQQVFLRREIVRGEVARLIGASPRTAQKVTGELLAQRLLTSASPKGPLQVGLPGTAAADYFPNLYPAGAD